MPQHFPVRLTELICLRKERERQLELIHSGVDKIKYRVGCEGDGKSLGRDAELSEQNGEYRESAAASAITSRTRGLRLFFLKRKE